MATADDAKQRLMAGMRKSKTGAATKKAATTKKASASTTRKKAATRKPAARQAAPSGGKATPASRSPGAIRPAGLDAVTQHASGDPYQSNGRIWPD